MCKFAVSSVELVTSVTKFSVKISSAKRIVDRHEIQARNIVDEERGAGTLRTGRGVRI